MPVLRRSSPHEWVASSGTSPRYSRELESNWTLARSAWHVTTMPAWSLVQDFSPSLAKYHLYPQPTPSGPAPLCSQVVDDDRKGLWQNREQASLLWGMKWVSAHPCYTALTCTSFGGIYESCCSQEILLSSPTFLPFSLSPHQCGLTQTKQNLNIWPMAHDKPL